MLWMDNNLYKVLGGSLVLDFVFDGSGILDFFYHGVRRAAKPCSGWLCFASDEPT